jgi:hypothetical protein
MTGTNAVYSIYNAINAGLLPDDPEAGIYLVLASKDVYGKIAHSLDTDTFKDRDSARSGVDFTPFTRWQGDIISLL